MHDFVSGLVSNKKKDHSVQTSVQRLGKRRREQKDIIPLTSMSLLVCVCVIVLLPSIVYCHPVPQKAELFWARTPEEQRRNGIRPSQRQQRTLGKGYLC